ncbi:patatin-like phospholipase family protein [Sorangium sp. So ce1078]|uniref:patatin-like phospholipase family protein n=1 Tax=Sorangium sp. So ce1078 TaxID=3133329 RepID=UPI003F5EBEE3
MNSPREQDSSFIFPSSEPLPIHDEHAGIAMGKSGLRGVYMAGVVHAFVICGYYPGTVVGTSAGCLAGTVLALAGELRSQAERLALVSEHLDAWMRNPGEHVLTCLSEGPFGRLVGDLVDIDLPLGKVVDRLGEALSGKPSAWVSLVCALPPHLRSCILRAALETSGDAAEALFRDGQLLALLRGQGGAAARVTEDLSLRFAQKLLTAYGMSRSLVEGSLVDTHFGEAIARHAPSGWKTCFEHIENTSLLFQVANLSSQRRRDGTPRLELIGKRPGRRRDFSGANLFAALRASCAFAPVFPGVRMKELFGATPRHLRPEDLLMDAAQVERDPLSPAVTHWAGLQRSPKLPYRLFAVYSEPTGEVSPPDETSFFTPALHNLLLRSRLDQQYISRVIEMITDMIQTLQEAGAPVPQRASGGAYVPVRITGIAPRAALPFLPVSVPREKDLAEASATGCRSALEVLLAPRIRELCKDRPSVPCREALDAARAAHQGGTRDGAPIEDYFAPLKKVCAHCPGQLFPLPPRSDARGVNDFAPFHEDRRRGEDTTAPPAPLTVIVPAGGVFLGAFQVGAIAALKEYEIRPDLYAGASVGTIFSYLLQACLKDQVGSRQRDRETLAEVIQLLYTVPSWIDAVGDDAPAPPPARRAASWLSAIAGQLGLRNGSGQAPRGRVDRIRETIAARWRSEAVRPLRELTPREIVDVFASPAGLTSAEAQARWERLRRGAEALFFAPAPDPRAGSPRPFPGGATRASDYEALRGFLLSLARLRLDEATGTLDAIAASLGCFAPDHPDRGEIIGFDNLERHLRRIVFGGGDPTLELHSSSERVRYIFSVTNHTRGVPESFGYDDELAPEQPSPMAVQACLAASSFPLAFRRRSRREIFGRDSVDRADDLFADGGIFNNFPSDTAFSYLRWLSAKPETRWIGAAEHRVLLLSLTSPMFLRGKAAAARSRDEEGLTFALLRSYAIGEDEKVEKTLIAQQHINTLAEAANPILRSAGRPQAILADMDLIAPTYTIYEHPFAFKPYLGFDERKQGEMIASGCRRTRIAMEWRRYQERQPGRRDEHRDGFMEMIRRDEEDGRREDPRRKRGLCVFRQQPPAGERKRERCPFFEDERTRRVYAQCCDTVGAELAPPDWKLHWRLRQR